MIALFHRRSKSRGFKEIVLVLLLSLLISTIFMFWTMAIQTPLLLSNRLAAESQAQSASRYCLEWAHGNFKEKKTAFSNDIYWGRKIGILEAPDKDSSVKPKEEEPEFGTLTFRKEAGIPHSTNNLNGTSVIIGWNQTVVPPGFVHLVSVGHHHGIQAVSELLLQQREFPFAIATAGSLEATNLESYSVESLEAFEDGVISDDEKRDSGLLSNSDSVGAITLGGTSKVQGDVTARGTIVLNGDVSISGDQIEGGSPQEIPDYKATDFDPTGQKYTKEWAGQAELIDGARVYNGDLTLTDDLEFEDGLLYVKGKVTIEGTIRGKGALVAEGDIHVTTGRMDLANDVNALVSGGDITIDGQSPDSSTYKGIVYAEGSINFKRTTVVGASVSSDTQGKIQMDEVKAITAPKLDKMLIEKHIKLDEAMESGAAARSGGSSDEIGILLNGSDFTALDPTNEEALKALAAGLKPGDEGTTWKVVVRKKKGAGWEYQDAGPGWSKNNLESKKLWADYVGEHAVGKIDKVKIFAIDLNKALSLEGDIEVWHRKTQSYNGPN